AGGQGYLCPVANRRRQIAVLPIAGHGQYRPDGRGFTPDCANERSGGWLAGKRCAGDVPELVTSGRRITGPFARTASGRVPFVVRRARTVDALRFSGRSAALERELAGHRRSALHQ